MYKNVCILLGLFTFHDINIFHNICYFCMWSVKSKSLDINHIKMDLPFYMLIDFNPTKNLPFRA